MVLLMLLARQYSSWHYSTAVGITVLLLALQYCYWHYSTAAVAVDNSVLLTLLA